ncbi:MAG: ROK family protein [Nitrospirae bacterium]|nr:MAG: ROK family protein [Nitrospirota bacterium]
MKSVYKKKTKATGGPEVVIEQIVLSVEDILKQHNSKIEDIEALGIGVPGMVDENSGVVISAPNLYGWKDIALKDKMEEILGIPVIIGNDVNMGLFGEYRFGVAKDYRNIVGVFVGTGIGGAIIIDGKILTGANNLAGEIGHMVIDRKSNMQCGCGNYGCIEASAGRLGIVKRIASKIKKGKRSIVSSICKKNMLKLRSGKLKKAIDAGDEVVSKEVKRASKEIGIAIANILNILDPEAVVLGGGVIEALGDFMLPFIKRSISQHTVNYGDRKTKILMSILGDYSTIMGAASYALEKLILSGDRHPLDQKNQDLRENQLILKDQ